jgi:ribonuclease HII
MNQELEKLIQHVLLNDEEKTSEKEYALYSKYIEMSAYENDLYNRKVKLIAGIDEVGRGPIAGPVVAAAVILPHDFYLPGLNDSKQVSAKKRKLFYDIITKEAISYHIGMCSVEEIDRFNILQCSKLAMKRAVEGLTIKPEHLLIDAISIDVDLPQTNIIKGDGKSISIAASSIVAKVTRDQLMEDLGKQFPQYGFEKNAGYGTKQHIEAIGQFGVTCHHRKTFEPVKSYILKQNT